MVLSEPQFYPAIYVLVSKLLDEFGKLVYDRLYTLAVSPSSSRLYGQNQHNFVPQSAADHDQSNNNGPSSNHHHHPNSTESVDSDSVTAPIDDEKGIAAEDGWTDSLPLNFRSSHCSNLCSAKCSNWFSKISAIRELVPRVLIEIALFRCLRFLYPLWRWMEYSKLLMLRLRGISDPLIAGYVRLFAAEQMFVAFGTASFRFQLRSNVVVDSVETLYVAAVHDVLFVFGAMFRSKFASIDCVFYAQMESVDYLNLYHPLFEALFAILNHGDVFAAAHELGLYLRRHIEPELLALIDLDSFLNVEAKRKADPFVLRLDRAANIYNKHRSDSGLSAIGSDGRRRRTRKSEPHSIAAFVDMLAEGTDGEEEQLRDDGGGAAIPKETVSK